MGLLKTVLLIVTILTLIPTGQTLVLAIKDFRKNELYRTNGLAELLAFHSFIRECLRVVKHVILVISLATSLVVGYTPGISQFRDFMAAGMLFLFVATSIVEIIFRRKMEAEMQRSIDAGEVKVMKLIPAP